MMHHADHAILAEGIQAKASSCADTLLLVLPNREVQKHMAPLVTHAQRILCLRCMLRIIYARRTKHVHEHMLIAVACLLLSSFKFKGTEAVRWLAHRSEWCTVHTVYSGPIYICL